jgi:class 3 adenylate cyclase/tetratricopeptide (TPR) repeat protein
VTKLAVERRVITALFVDVVGSTSLTAELGPERLKRALERAFSAFESAIVAEGGVVEKYVGDAIYALFGAPVAHSDDPLRALRAADSCRQLSQGADLASLPLAVRVGAETGEAIVDLEATSTARQQMSVGTCVNLAARLQQLAEPGQVLVGPACRREAGDAVTFTSLGVKDLKGIGASEVWRLDSMSGAGSARPAAFVGRAPELALLRLAFGRAQKSRSVFALVSGPPGQGKTRLVHEFIAGLGPSATVVSARCRPAGERGAQDPLRQLLPSAPDGLDACRMEELFSDERERQQVVSALSHSAGITVEQGLLALPPDQRHDEIANGWRRYAASLARHQPLVIWLDDLHWAESTVVQLFDRLTLGAALPMMVVATARPEISGQTEIRPGGDRFFITLDGLDPESARQLALTAGAGSPSEVDRAEGNPLFILELARASRSGAIPLTLHGAIGSRLDELQAEDRELLQQAAVVGDMFTTADAALLCGRSPADIAPALDRLADRQYLQRVAGGHRYHHALVRDVAYARLTAATRLRLHARYALDGVAEGDVEGIAHHLWEAVGHPDAEWVWEGDADLPALRALALTTHVAAARRAAARSSHQAARIFGERALRFCSTPDDSAMAERAIAQTHASAGEADEALAHFMRARDLYRDAGSAPPPSFYPDALELPIYRSGMFRTPLALAEVDELLEEGLAVCRGSDDVTSLTRLTAASAYRWHDANRLVEALGMADRVSNATPLAFSLGHAAIMQNRLGDFAVAAATYERLDRIIESTGLPDRQYEFRALLALSTGDIARAEAIVAEFMEASASRGPHLRTHAMRELGHVLLARGSWPALRALSDDTERLMAEHPQTAFCYAVTTSRAFAAVADVMEGHAREASSLVPRAEEPLQGEPYERESLLALLYGSLGRHDALETLMANVASRGDRPFWFFHRMVAVAFTMLEQWDRVEAALEELRRVAGRDTAYLTAFVAAVREELAAARGGSRPVHEDLRRLGYLGWSQLLSHRAAKGR